MKVPIRVNSVTQNPDGTANIDIEFDEDVKCILMKAWGITEWDDERAQREFVNVIRESLKGKEVA